MSDRRTRNEWVWSRLSSNDGRTKWDAKNERSRAKKGKTTAEVREWDEKSIANSNKQAAFFLVFLAGLSTV
jgi:hypothetical protein